MNKKCECGSYAINETQHGRKIGTDSNLCDVCYWRKRADLLVNSLNNCLVLLEDYQGTNADMAMIEKAQGRLQKYK